jgi:hypothetical protein
LFTVIFFLGPLETRYGEQCGGGSAGAGAQQDKDDPGEARLVACAVLATSISLCMCERALDDDLFVFTVILLLGPFVTRYVEQCGGRRAGAGAQQTQR